MRHRFAWQKDASLQLVAIPARNRNIFHAGDRKPENVAGVHDVFDRKFDASHYKHRRTNRIIPWCECEGSTDHCRCPRMLAAKHRGGCMMGSRLIGLCPVVRPVCISDICCDREKNAPCDMRLATSPGVAGSVPEIDAGLPLNSCLPQHRVVLQTRQQHRHGSGGLPGFVAGGPIVRLLRIFHCGCGRVRLRWGFVLQQRLQLGPHALGNDRLGRPVRVNAVGLHEFVAGADAVYQ